MLITSLAKLKNHRSPFYAGFVISFLGSLPPGTVNVLLVQIAGSQHFSSACWFALGSVMAELVCVKVCLTLMNKVMKLSIITRLLQWLSLLVLVVLAIVSFIRFSTDEISFGVTSVFHGKSPLLWGFVFMIINPVQIPFWMGWTSVLFENKILTLNAKEDHFYMIGIGSGSVLASVLFIAAGHSISFWLFTHQRLVHFLFGCLFITMALLQARKMIRLKQEK
jgi:threonine/homoserine/homoserine lactone efflux protein